MAKITAVKITPTSTIIKRGGVSQTIKHSEKLSPANAKKVAKYLLKYGMDVGIQVHGRDGETVCEITLLGKPVRTIQKEAVFGAMADPDARY